MRAHRRTGAVVALAALVVAASAATGSHTIRRGETLSGIAKAHGTSVSALAAANGITNVHRIREGQTLSIPGGGGGGGSAAPARHVVRPGESLAAIAKRYGTTVEALAKANGITNPNRIYAGAGLLLSAQAPAAPAAAAAPAAVHVVQSGETLGAIAKRYGTSVSAIASANGISNPNRIRLGQRLQVAGAGGGWLCPVPGASFINDWGFARSGGRFHEGTDLMAPRGTPVLAPVSGTVRQYDGRIGGLQFHLDGDDGSWYIGSHLDRFGESGRVTAGTVVGYVGDSGNARGGPPHLHFEIHPGGRDAPATNPYPALRAACG